MGLAGSGAVDDCRWRGAISELEGEEGAARVVQLTPACPASHHEFSGFARMILIVDSWHVYVAIGVST